MAFGWNESNAGTAPCLVIVTYNEVTDHLLNVARGFVFQIQVPVSGNTNEISLNLVWRFSNGVFLKEAVKGIINSLSKTKKTENHLYNLGKNRTKWPISMYLQSHHHNFKTIFNQNMVLGSLFSSTDFWGLSLHASNGFLFRNKWDCLLT